MMRQAYKMGMAIGCIAVIFIFYKIAYTSHFTKVSFEKQRLEKIYQDKVQQLALQKQKIIALQDPAYIKNYATSSLGMQKISHKQLRTFNYA